MNDMTGYMTGSPQARVGYDCKMLTYGPSSNTFMDQIGPFIDMYIRRTVLNGSNPIKNSLNRGNIFHFKIYDRNV